MRPVLIVLTMLLAAPARGAEPPVSHDPQVADATRLFSQGCVDHIGDPGGTRAWADGQGFPRIGPGPLTEVLIGPGDKGAAWMIPGEGPHLALSIRGRTEACAVWAERADPVEATTIFRRIMAGTERPGVRVERQPDATRTTPYGALRTEMYQVSGNQPGRALVFTLITVERPGGVFQVNMQVAVARTGE